MLHIIIFSYNRAIQLDYLLRSILSRFHKPKYFISIIYHTSGNHAEGYQKLRDIYEKIEFIKFYERESAIMSFYTYLPTLNSFINIKLFLKNTIFRNKNSDNFKRLLEKLIANSNSEFVMFNTDDGYFFDDVYIQDDVFNLIKSDPLQTSYRLYVGENLSEFPDYIEKSNLGYIKWNYYENDKITHWTYPFAVDGTIYHAKSLMKFLKKVFYTNPVNLEGYAVRYVMKNKLMSIGLSPITSKLIGTKLNRVSTETLNPTLTIDTNYLNEKYLEGYLLELEIPTKITNANIVPSNVSLVKNGLSKSIYSIDKQGQYIQSLLGIEGAKNQSF